MKHQGKIGVVAIVRRLRSRALGTDMSMLSKTRPSCAGLAHGEDAQPGRPRTVRNSPTLWGLFCSACPQRLWISER